MPMNTMLDSRRFSSEVGHSPRSSRATCTCATISAAVRLRTSPCVPVWQKLQFSVQPTWLETQSAPERATSGMNTVSTSIPGAKRISHLMTPSALSWRDVTSGRASANRSASAARVSLAMSVIAAKSVTP